MAEPGPEFAPAAGAAVTGRRRRMAAVLAAALAFAACGWLAWRPATELGRRGRDRFRQWQIQRFLAQANDAARLERPQVARVALESASALAPGNWEIRLRRSDLLMQLGEREQAYRLWNEWLAGPASLRPPQLPLLLAGRLVVAGDFSRLLDVALREFSAAQGNSGLWFNLAAESAALAGVSEAEAALHPPRYAEIRPLLLGYAQARARQPAPARENLASAAERALPWPQAVLLARGWLMLGDHQRGRLALARTSSPVDARSAVIQEAFFVERGSAAETRLQRGVLPRGLSAEERGRRALLFMLFTLDAPSPEAAAFLTAEFLPVEASLDISLVSSFWLYGALARAEREEREWRARLEARLRAPPPPVGSEALTVPLLRLTIDRVPLPLEFVCALMARTQLPVGGNNSGKPRADGSLSPGEGAEKTLADREDRGSLTSRP